MSIGLEKEYIFRLLSKDDLEMAVEFIHKHYTLNEPIRQMITKDVEQCFELDKERIIEKLKDTASFGVFNKSGVMVASAFSGVNTRCQKSLCCHGDFKRVTWFNHIDDLVLKLEGNLMDELKTNKFLMLSLLTVDPQYQRQGLARELVKITEGAAKRLNCEYMVVNASSYYTQTLLEKCGYTKLKEIKYDGAFDPSLNVKPNPPHLTCAIYFKQM